MKIEFKSEVYSLGEISLKELKRYKMIMTMFTIKLELADVGN